MKVCVTGASGFLGQYIIQALNLAGHCVVALDVRTVPTTAFSTRADIYNEWLEADITTPLPPILGLDAVIHLAALANPRECDSDPAKAFSVNVNGTSNVLRMALASGAKKFVFSSSAHVYGISPKYLPTPENHPLYLQNTYTTTKILGEQLCQLYYENHGLGYTTLRLYNAYGPDQQLGYFIPDLISKAKSGSLALSGGNTTKDFVYVDDVAQAFLLALQTPFVGPLNIGTGEETRLEDIARVIADKMGVELVASPSANGSRMQADNSRAKRVLGWEPRVGIWEGLRAAVDSASTKPVPA